MIVEWTLYLDGSGASLTRRGQKVVYTPCTDGRSMVRSWR